MGLGTKFDREIREQPDALARLLAQSRESAEAIAEAIRAAGADRMVCVARGSSDNAARYAKYLFGIRDQMSVELAAPSMYTLFQRPPKLNNAVVVGISQSGQSRDIVTVVEEARRQGTLTVAITNDPASPLAQTADYCLPLQAGVEYAVAASKTYTNQLMALAMLATALTGDTSGWKELATIPDAVERTLALNRDVARSAERFRYAGHFVVIGRGYNYATAFELALKIKETCYVLAEPYSTADFLHGPIALIEQGFPAILVAPSGVAYSDTAELLDLLDERDAEVIAISERTDLLERVRTPLPLAPGVPEWLSPIVAVVPGQLWGAALAIARGIDPDRPRGLKKVTDTY